MGWEKGLSSTDMLIVDNFRRMQKWDYHKKFGHAMEVAKAYYDINRDEGRNVHVSVGGLDSIVLLIFLREICDIDVPAISVSSLEDASIQRIHKQLGVQSLPSAKKEDGTRWTKAKKDKQFQKFLFSNADAVREYGPAATIGAYKSGETIPQTYAKQYRRRCILKKIPAASNFDINIERFEKYCEENEIDYSLYNDYLEAIVGLELDLKDTKNLFPKEFMRLHDLRVAEYGVTVINKDKVKRKKFYDAFAKKGKKAAAYEMSYKGLCIVAPRDLSELKVEGKVLGHCVGDMGYDKRMVDGQILIMFVRKESDISTPFVTVEYDIKNSKIKQAYGRKNTAPPEEVTILLDKWLKMMKKLQKQKKAG